MATRNTGVYTDEERSKIIAHVLSELSAGIPISRTLGPDREQGLCAERTFWNWYYESDATDPNELVQKVARAREAGIEAQIDRALLVAETPMPGEVVIEKPAIVEGKPVVENGQPVMIREVRTEDMLGHRKLLIESTFKAAQMLKPKSYSPKLDVTSDGQQIGFAGLLEAARRRAQDGSAEPAK